MMTFCNVAMQISWIIWWTSWRSMQITWKMWWRSGPTSLQWRRPGQTSFSPACYQSRFWICCLVMFTFTFPHMHHSLLYFYIIPTFLKFWVAYYSEWIRSTLSVTALHHWFVVDTLQISWWQGSLWSPKAMTWWPSSSQTLWDLPPCVLSAQQWRW